ncbi:heterokaryon incompatibility, partial [Dactylonectria estremocensis]
YVALSYCWGSDLSGVVTTLSSNVEPHLQGIAVNSLPQIIQDAVRVYRELGLRYLWVDSLCIIQDDRKDWAQEVDRMRKVY